MTLVEALQKLGATQASARQALLSKAKHLAELAQKAKQDPDMDDTDRANAV